MNFFIIGDVHGCYLTLEKMLHYWNKQEELLIFVGDLINRGNYSAKVLAKCMELTATGNCVVVKGNHEQEFIKCYEKKETPKWKEQGGEKTIQDFHLHQLDDTTVYNWLITLPLSYENPAVMVTHAGITATANPFIEDSEEGVLWNRQPLMDIGRLQVHGHKPLRQTNAVFDDDAQAINIDTGAIYGFGLTGIKVLENAYISEILHVDTIPADIT